MVGFQGVAEVKREQSGPQGCPQQAEEQKDTLVAPSFVSVEVEKPELDVHNQEQHGVQSCVEDSEAKLDRWGDGRAQGDWRRQGGGIRRSGCDWCFHQNTDRPNFPLSQRNCQIFSSQPDRFAWDLKVETKSPEVSRS